jgi:hypothetical protein
MRGTAISFSASTSRMALQSNQLPVQFVLGVHAMDIQQSDCDNNQSPAFQEKSQIYGA